MHVHEPRSDRLQHGGSYGVAVDFYAAPAFERICARNYYLPFALYVELFDSFCRGTLRVYVKLRPD